MTTQPETPMVERVSRLEGAYDQVNERLGDLRIDVREGDAALRAEIREGDAALRAEIREGDAALRAEIREGDAALRAEIREGDAALRAEMTKQFHTLLVLIGTFWATTLGGIIAILVRG